MQNSLETRRKRRFGALARLAMATACLFLLSGCLLDRIREVQAQSCDFDRYFALETGGVNTLTFHEPVFLKSDVERLLGFEPWESSQDGQQATQRYRVAQMTATGGKGEIHEFELRFAAEGNDWRLTSLRMPGVVGHFVDEGLAVRAAGKACDAEWTWSGLGITQTLSPEDLEFLPGRGELLAALGAPTRVNADGGSLTYAFQPLVPSSAPQELSTRQSLAEFTIHFDDEAQPARLESAFRGLHAKADFRSLEAHFSYRVGGRVK